MGDPFEKMFGCCFFYFYFLGGGCKKAYNYFSCSKTCCKYSWNNYFIVFFQSNEKTAKVEKKQLTNVELKKWHQKKSCHNTDPPQQAHWFRIILSKHDTVQNHHTNRDTTHHFSLCICSVIFSPISDHQYPVGSRLTSYFGKDGCLGDQCHDIILRHLDISQLPPEARRSFVELEEWNSMSDAQRLARCRGWGMDGPRDGGKRGENMGKTWRILSNQVDKLVVYDRLIKKF